MVCGGGEEGGGLLGAGVDGGFVGDVEGEEVEAGGEGV